MSATEQVLAVTFALLVFTLFAWIVVDMERERLTHALRAADRLALEQARRVVARDQRIADLELTVTAMHEANRNQLGEPIFDEIAYARLRKAVTEHGMGGTA